MSGELQMRKMTLFILIFIFLLSNGCMEKKVNNVSKDNKSDKYLVYNMQTIPEDLILLDDSKVRDKDMLLPLFEGLVKTDDNGKIVPGLAESWIIGKDDITYTFKLRENASWSDGSSITAKDFQKFFNEILNPKLDNIYAYQLNYIFGAQDYRNNKKSFNGVAIRVVDDKTLEIRLNAPISYFLEILSQPIYTLRKVNNELKTWKESYKSILYSGPFKIEDISKEGEIALVKNDHYYDKAEVKSDKLYITSSLSSENALAQYKTNKINIFVNPPISETKDLIVDGDAEVIPVDSGASISFNLKKTGIISNSGFRKAISFAIDRGSLLQSEFDYIARSATAYVPYESEKDIQNIKAKALFKQSGDVEESKKLLKESNYTKKEKLKLVYLDNNENKRLCEAVVKDIKDDLDLSLEYKGYSETELIDVLKSGEYHMLIVNYALLYDDPISLLESWISNSELNLFSYKNSNFDTLVTKAKFEKDEVKRQEFLKDAEKLLLEDMPTIPIYFHNIVLCKRPTLQGIYVTKEGNVKLDRAYLET